MIKAIIIGMVIVILISLYCAMIGQGRNDDRDDIEQMEFLAEISEKQHEHNRV